MAWVCLEVYAAAVIDPFNRAVKDASKSMKLPEDEPLFWSFPWTLKAIPQQPYRGTDPEWQMYIKLNGDGQLQKRIRGRSVAEFGRPRLTVLLRRAGGDCSRGRFRKSGAGPAMWEELEDAKILALSRLSLFAAAQVLSQGVRVPVVPAPGGARPTRTLTRRRVEFTDDGITVEEREIDPRVAQDIRRLLFPAPLASSLFSFGSTLLKQNYNDLKAYLGIQQSQAEGSQSQQPAHSQRIQKDIGNLQRQATKEPSAANAPSAMEKGTAPGSADGSTPTSGSTPSTPAPGSTPSTPPSTTSTSKGDQAVETSTPSRQPPPPKADPALDKVVVDLGQLGFPLPSMRQHIDGAWNNLKKTLAARSRRPPPIHTSGSILVSGIVELDTDRAIVLLDVYSFWDPKTGKYDHATTRMGLRRLKLKQQRPLR